MKVLVTGGAGFVGSHTAEHYAKKGDDVVVYDNLSRARLLGSDSIIVDYNWNFLKQFENIRLVRADICDKQKLEEEARGADVIIHTAAQTAVTTSVEDPETDFMVNALGTFSVMEAARKTSNSAKVIYCSTNKVYGENVNEIPVEDRGKRYSFEKKYSGGIPETFDIDLCEHTPYGCSKLVGDLYAQDYGHLYGLTTGVFRMSCIYGTRQFGVEDQGWVAHFTISALKNQPVTIYGDGKQVRDVLYITDLVAAFDKFIERGDKSQVFNIGGGPDNTLSLLELLEILKRHTGKEVEHSFSEWRPSDQKVYISDISKAKKELSWEPTVGPKIGVEKIVNWVGDNKDIFKG